MDDAMKMVSVSPERATIDMSMEELGLVMNALWAELGISEPRTGPLDSDLRDGYEALAAATHSVITAMDAASGLQH